MQLIRTKEDNPTCVVSEAGCATVEPGVTRRALFQLVEVDVGVVGAGGARVLRAVARAIGAVVALWAVIANVGGQVVTHVTVVAWWRLDGGWRVKILLEV